MERKDQACRVYDNVKMIPVMYEREFGTLANKTIPCVLEGDHLSGGCDWSDASGQNSGLNSMPKGHKSLRLYDADEYLDVEAGDLVELPAEFADCADPCSAKPRSKTIQCVGFPAFRGLWMDEGAAKYREQSLMFFPALQKAMKGDKLNGIVMDNERIPESTTTFLVQPLSEFNNTDPAQARRCLRARYTAVQNDARFGPVLGLLDSRGWNVTERSGKEWLADAMMPLSEPWTSGHGQMAGGAYLTQGGTLDMNRVVWNAVGLERVSQYWSTAIGEVARAVFPGLVHSNYGRFVWSAEHCTPDSAGWNRCRAGVGSSGYDASAPSVYDEQTSIHCHNTSADGHWSPRLNRTVPAQDPGCYKNPGADIGLHQFGGVPYGAVNRSEYSFMVLQVNHGRSSLLADPSKPVRPWFADKSFCAAGLPDYLAEGPNQYYEERVLHFSMLSDSTVYVWGPWAGFAYGTRATMADWNLLSSLLRELDALIGCEDRTWIPDAAFRYTDGFFLSGSEVGKKPEHRNVWRMTPRLPLMSGSMNPQDLIQPPSDDGSLNASTFGGDLVLKPVLFDWGAANGGPSKLVPSALHFPGGVVATVDTSSWPALFPSPSSTTGNETRPSPAAWGLWIVQGAGSGGVRVVAEEGGMETDWPVRQP
jgi:hypothetical protein